MPKDPIEAGLQPQEKKGAEPLEATREDTAGLKQMLESLYEARDEMSPGSEDRQDIEAMILAYKTLMECDGSHSRAIQDLKNQMQADKNNEMIKQAIGFLKFLSESSPFSRN